MKKSELKALLKIIAEEVVAAKKSRIDENKALSGFKKSSEKVAHTEKVADSKSLTPNSEPKEKKEGKKLPVKDNKSNTETDHFVSDKNTPTTPSGEKKESKALPVGGHGSIKEEILAMIRESIEEMARTAGSIGAKYKVEDPNSPTGWVVKGHPTIPDGTPTEAPKGPYVKKGTNPNMGRPKSTPSTAPASPATNARTEEAVEEYIKYNPDANEAEVIDAISDKSTEETPLNLDVDFIKKAIQSAKAEAGSGTDSGEPDIAKLAAAERSARDAKMNRLRAYLMKKKGLK